MKQTESMGELSQFALPRLQGLVKAQAQDQGAQFGKSHLERSLENWGHQPTQKREFRNNTQQTAGFRQETCVFFSIKLVVFRQQQMRFES